MARTLHWFWREVVVGVGVATGLYARWNISPTTTLIELLGEPSEIVFVLTFIIGIFPLVIAFSHSLVYGHIIGIGAFLLGIWAGFILTEAPKNAILLLMLAAALAGVAPGFKHWIQR